MKLSNVSAGSQQYLRTQKISIYDKILLIRVFFSCIFEFYIQIWSQHYLSRVSAVSQNTKNINLWQNIINLSLLFLHIWILHTNMISALSQQGLSRVSAGSQHTKNSNLWQNIIDLSLPLLHIWILHINMISTLSQQGLSIVSANLKGHFMTNYS